VYGIEERPVPASTVPGEVVAKTQPFPVKPPPLGKNTFRIEEMYDRSPEHARFCKELFESNKMRIGEPYTPFAPGGPDGENTLIFPSTLGGGNWGGVSIDPEQGRLFVNVMHIGQWGHYEKKGEEWIRTSSQGPYARFWDRETRIPCSNPPFGEMIAIDLATGDIAWRSVLGRIEALEAIGVRNTGTLSLGGSVATAGGLLFIAATNDQRFRAFGTKSGKLLWETKLEANGHTSPITYMGRDGRQYVTLMAGGGGGFFGGPAGTQLVSFALPEVPRKALPAVVSKAVVNGSEPAPATVNLPAGGAKALMEKTCSAGCHSLDVVTSQRMSKTEWAALVQTMVARGAKLSDAQAKAVVEYLATTYGKR